MIRFCVCHKRKCRTYAIFFDETLVVEGFEDESDEDKTRHASQR